MALNEFAEEVLRLAADERVHCRIGDVPQDMQVDPERMSRAVVNLIDNALKFSAPDAPVELRVDPGKQRVGRRTVGRLAISVLDRGPGVAEEDRKRMFEPFEQGGEQLTSAPGGT